MIGKICIAASEILHPVQSAMRAHSAPLSALPDSPHSSREQARSTVKTGFFHMRAKNSKQEYRVCVEDEIYDHGSMAHAIYGQKVHKRITISPNSRPGSS